MDSETRDPHTGVTPRSWIQRNWNWVFPASLLLMIGLALGFTVLMLTVVMHPAKNSPTYREAVRRVATHPVALEHLGSGIRPGWVVTGRSEQTAGGRGLAEMTIPLSGSRGDGSLHVIGRREEGRWVITSMELEVERSNQRVDLLSR